MREMENYYKISNRRYLGSKTKLLDFIHKTIKKEDISFYSFLDLFGGTGVVADSFNDGKHKIIINDMLECNRCSYNAFFGKEEIDEKKMKKYISSFNKLDIIEENYFSLNFSETFFSNENCKKIGYIREEIDKLYKENLLNSREKDYLITSLIYAMDHIANTVGHYDAYRKGGDLNKKLNLQLLLINKPGMNNNNEIYKMDSNELAKKIKCDLVYIDPPYNSRQYCDAYHLLENVALWEKPDVFGVARKMDRSSLKSKYCENSAPRVFERLIKDLNCKYIIVSYNNMGLKGVGRSQAKISDIDIVRSLEQKGEVVIYETEFNQFTTGKSNIQDHKERLFVCKVGVFKKQENIKILSYVKSPLNYTGGKYKLLDELFTRFPKDNKTFIDLFGGGFNVGVNANANNIVYNDISKETKRLIELFYKYSGNEILEKLENLIRKYKLSDSSAYGYEFYNCTSSNGLGSYNKQGFINLREAYNNSKSSEEKDFLLLLLIVYSFNNQIRFNSNGNYNLPVGKRDLNNSMRKNIKLFSEKIKSKEVIFTNKDFSLLRPELYEEPFYYCDPPYLLGDASYNENGGWNVENEKRLMNFLKDISDKGTKFALSNVIEHKGKVNEELLKWAIQNKFNIIYLDKNYSNSNYQSKAKNNKTVEVLITNY